MPPVTQALLIANVLVFLLAGERHAAASSGSRSGRRAASARSFEPWQLVTYGFLHGEPRAHLLQHARAVHVRRATSSGCSARASTPLYYFACVVSAAICHLVVTALDGRRRPMPTVGASGGVYGLLLAFGALLPAPARDAADPADPDAARALFVIAFAAIELFFGVTGTAAGVAHFAHLGGMLGGWLMIEYRRQRLPFAASRCRFRLQRACGGARLAPATRAVPIVAHAGTQRAALPGRSRPRWMRSRASPPAASRSDEGVVVHRHHARAGSALSAALRARRGRHARLRCLRGQLRLFGPKSFSRSCMSRGAPDRLAFNEAIGGCSRPDAHALPGAARFRGAYRSPLGLSVGARRPSAIERFWIALADTQALSLLCACARSTASTAAPTRARCTAFASQHTQPRPPATPRSSTPRELGDGGERRDPRSARSPARRHAARALGPEAPVTHMPAGQAVMLWLRQHMPRTAEKGAGAGSRAPLQPFPAIFALTPFPRSPAPARKVHEHFERSRSHARPRCSCSRARHSLSWSNGTANPKPFPPCPPAAGAAPRAAARRLRRISTRTSRAWSTGSPRHAGAAHHAPADGFSRPSRSRRAARARRRRSPRSWKPRGSSSSARRSAPHRGADRIHADGRPGADAARRHPARRPRQRRHDHAEPARRRSSNSSAGAARRRDAATPRPPAPVNVQTTPTADRHHRDGDRAAPDERQPGCAGRDQPQPRADQQRQPGVQHQREPGGRTPARARRAPRRAGARRRSMPAAGERAPATARPRATDPRGWEACFTSMGGCAVTRAWNWSARRRPARRPAAAEPAQRQSLLRLGYNCCAVARAERVALLVDAEAYFRGVLPGGAARAALDHHPRLGLQQPDAAALRPGAEGRPAGAARRLPQLPGARAAAACTSTC